MLISDVMKWNNKYNYPKSSRSIEFSEWLSLYNEFNLNFNSLNYKEKFHYDEKKNKIGKKNAL